MQTSPIYFSQFASYIANIWISWKKFKAPPSAIPARRRSRVLKAEEPAHFLRGENTPARQADCFLLTNRARVKIQWLYQAVWRRQTEPVEIRSKMSCRRSSTSCIIFLMISLSYDTMPGGSSVVIPRMAASIQAKAPGRSHGGAAYISLNRPLLDGYRFHCAMGN
jgi:hypothetical protein